MRSKWSLILGAVLATPSIFVVYFPVIQTYPETYPHLRLSFGTGACGVYQKVIQAAFLEPEGQALFGYLSHVYAFRPRVVHLLEGGERDAGEVDGVYSPGHEYIKKEMPSVPPELWDALSRKMDRAPVPDCHFAIPIKVRILSREEYGSIFREPCIGWRDFYARYPDSRGIMALSPVAFGPKRLDALVLISIQSRGLEGAGYFAYLRREKGTWVVKEAAEAWVS